MLRIILIALIIILPIFFVFIYYIRLKFVDKDAKLFDYTNLKIFSVLLVLMFIFYMIFLVFKLQEFSGEDIRPAIYRDGKIVK